MIRILLAAALVTFSAGAALAASDCTVATKGDSPTAKACATGGRAEAKKVMKGLVKDAKEKGGKFTCDGCHKDMDNYELAPNARNDFKKLLEMTGNAPAAPKAPGPKVPAPKVRK